jgi:hypothetical protein
MKVKRCPIPAAFSSFLASPAYCYLLRLHKPFSIFQALRQLLCHVSSENRALALRTVPGQGDTPICLALTRNDKEAILLLLEFCDTEHYWKCSKPIYRAAAELGSSQVLDVLLDVGIQYDSHDEYDGNPLHWIHVNSDLRMIERLKVMFSCNQRRT